MTANDFLTGHDAEFDRLVCQEELIVQVTEALTQALEHAGVKKVELAKRLGKSPGFVSQVFGGGRNLTLRTVADIAGALSLRPTLELSSDQDSLYGTVTGWRQERWSPVPRRNVIHPLPEPMVQHRISLDAAA